MIETLEKDLKTAVGCIAAACFAVVFTGACALGLCIGSGVGWFLWA